MRRLPALLLALAGCTVTGGGSLEGAPPGGEGGAPCTTDRQCPEGAVCERHPGEGEEDAGVCRCVCDVVEACEPRCPCDEGCTACDRAYAALTRCEALAGEAGAGGTGGAGGGGGAADPCAAEREAFATCHL